MDDFVRQEAVASDVVDAGEDSDPVCPPSTTATSMVQTDPPARETICTQTTPRMFVHSTAVQTAKHTKDKGI